jgi:hypothetical protein
MPAASRLNLLRAHYTTGENLDNNLGKPTGQSDAITWPELAGLFRRRDLAAVDRYLAVLQQHGVTCLRLLLAPFDTFWMWLHWSRHPYNRWRGGPCADRSERLLCRETAAKLLPCRCPRL